MRKADRQARRSRPEKTVYDITRRAGRALAELLGAIFETRSSISSIEKATTDKSSKDELSKGKTPERKRSSPPYIGVPPLSPRAGSCPRAPLPRGRRSARDSSAARRTKRGLGLCSIRRS